MWRQAVGTLAAGVQRDAMPTSAGAGLVVPGTVRCWSVWLPLPPRQSGGTSISLGVSRRGSRVQRRSVSGCPAAGVECSVDQSRGVSQRESGAASRSLGVPRRGSRVQRRGVSGCPAAAVGWNVDQSRGGPPRESGATSSSLEVARRGSRVQRRAASGCPAAGGVCNVQQPRGWPAAGG
jgi:hypothetical protein